MGGSHILISVRTSSLARVRADGYLRHHSDCLYDQWWCEMTGMMSGDQGARTFSHYGDRSDYEDWHGLLTPHLIALGNTHKGNKTD